MDVSHRVVTSALIVLALASCDSMELTIAVDPGPGGTLAVRNANAEPWSGAHLLVEAVESDNSTTVCAEETRSVWPPGESVPVPMCGDKTRLTLTVSGETARFSYANGQLFRRFGRKEVPVGSS